MRHNTSHGIRVSGDRAADVERLGAPVRLDATVLHVEDAESMRHVRRRILESAGFRVIEAQSLEDAWQAILCDRPDVVLTDVVLPDGDGFELTRRIKGDLSVASTRVIQISALFTETEHRVRGLNSGADAYLIEPVDPDEMCAVVGAVVRGRRTEQLLNTVIDGAPMLIAGADEEGRIAVFNPACEAVTGFRQQDVVGRPFVETLVCADDRDAVRRLFTRSSAPELALPYENRWCTASGEQRWIEWRCFPIAAPNGGAWIIGIGHDVTDRRRAEDAIRASEQRLSLALDNARMGMWELDLETGACEWSEQTALLFGLPRGTRAGTLSAFLELVHPDDREGILRAAQSAAPGLPYEVEFRTTWPDGTVHWISGRGQIAPKSDGTGLRLVGMGQDVTTRRQTEEQLQDVNRRKDAFIATVAHELRQPLAPIVAAVELMKRRVNRESGERARTVIEHQTRQMQRLIDDMLDAARIAQGKVALKREPIDVRALIVHTCEVVQPLFDRRRQPFKVTVADVPLWVDGDRDRLQQVLSNVLGNAAKYSDEGAPVHLSAEVAEHEVVLRVRDAGHGIDPAVLPRLFDLFVQASPDAGGLGLGLAVVKRLVEGHGGTVEAHSDGPGTGSEFVIRLPRIDEPG